MRLQKQLIILAVYCEISSCSTRSEMKILPVKTEARNDTRKCVSL